MKKNIFTLINTLAQQLINYDHPDEREQIAWWLLEKITGKKRTELLIQKEIVITEEQENIVQTMIHEHVHNKKPLQYIFGSVPFNDLEILVEPPVLIPRPETEEWVSNLINELKKLKNKKIRILDIGAGSGAIACTLGYALPEAEIIAIDIADEALALTKKNIAHNRLKNVSIIKSDLFTSLPAGKKFDLIVSNPPYISSSEYKELADSVREWEDKRALVAEHNGLALIEKIIKEAPSFIQKNDELFHLGIGQLYIEIGYKQGNAVKKIMLDALYNKVNSIKDLEGKDRLVTGRV